MLDAIAAWFGIIGQPKVNLQPLEVLSWQETAIFNLPTVDNDTLSQSIVKTYLQDLSNKGIDPTQQGIWVQSDWVEPVSNQGKIPLPAASLTKIATTLAALSK